MALPFVDRWSAFDRPEDLFVEHYAELIRWAQQLVGQDPAAAEDLVHDVFIRVVLRKPDLRALGNPKSYLFVTMRNVYLSQVRRRIVRSRDVMSVLDHDSAHDSLEAVKGYPERRAVYQELALVARYAAVRKQSSKGASVLILRFLHGYYPSEIARLLVTTPAAIDTRLRMARAEALTFIENPGRLRPFGGVPAFRAVHESVLGEADFLRTLRAQMFEARTDPCLSAEQLEALYTEPFFQKINTAVLAHLVSCATCLDVVNRALGLPLLAERDPSDTLGRGGRSGDGGGGTSQSGKELKTKLRTRLEDTLDDKPKELRIAVNGLFVCSQLVAGEISEQRVKLLLDERIGFIEVFSEYGTCLLSLIELERTASRFDRFYLRTGREPSER
jgi:RNA polymerase sigma factor (sigma-70 family)